MRAIASTDHGSRGWVDHRVLSDIPRVRINSEEGFAALMTKEKFWYLREEVELGVPR